MYRAVVGFVYDLKDYSVLLQKANNSPKKPPHIANRYNGIGGTIELGESPVGAMVRECREELGVDTTKDQWLQFHYNRRLDDAMLYFYATAVNGIRWSTRTNTQEPVRWFKVNDPVIHDETQFVYNLLYLLPMGHTYLTYPQHRYLEG